MYKTKCFLIFKNFFGVFLLPVFTSLIGEKVVLFSEICFIESFPEVGVCELRWRARYSWSRTCCCSTSRRTCWTCERSIGWRTICRNGRAPFWSFLTTESFSAPYARTLSTFIVDVLTRTAATTTTMRRFACALWPLNKLKLKIFGKVFISDYAWKANASAARVRGATADATAHPGIYRQVPLQRQARVNGAESHKDVGENVRRHFFHLILVF